MIKPISLNKIKYLNLSDLIHHKPEFDSKLSQNQIND